MYAFYYDVLGPGLYIWEIEGTSPPRNFPLTSEFTRSLPVFMITLLLLTFKPLLNSLT